MDKDKANSQFDFDNDPDFNENFYKNIEKALGDSNAAEQDPSSTDYKEEKINNFDTPEENLDEKPVEDAKTSSIKDNSVEKSEELKTNDISAETIQKESEVEDNGGIDDELTDINYSLAKQVSVEMEQESSELKIKKKRRLLKIQSSILLAVLCVVGFGFFLGFTKPGNSLLMRIGVNVGGTLWDNMTKDFKETKTVSADVDQLDDEDLKSTAPEVDPTTIKWPDHPGDGEHEVGVYNILLLGEDTYGMGNGKGRTDSIVIATLNTKDKSVKLTSLMRDTLVQIPGFRDNKLNSAYEKGGLDLLYKTIALNFDIRLDGCVMVNFKNFEKIVDDIGGIELTLKPNEAEYLNSTNYISNKKYRNVKAGKQLMNGNQVMGYARVRKTSTITGQTNDYGRTDRHRIILNTIFEKCKSLSKPEMLSLMFKFLPMITTDIDKSCFEAMLNSFIDMGMSTKNMQQLRIPADHTFEDNVRVRGMSVLIPDLDANSKILHDFIFSDLVTPTPAATVTPAASKTGSN